MAIEVKVPDIGDFKDVPVITVFVKPGDTVAKDDPLVELESDKATMEVPSPAAGKVAAVAIKEGDRVSEGTVILTLEGEGAALRRRPSAEAAPRRARRRPAATCTPRSWCSARGRAATPRRSARPTSGKKVVLIERDPTLGGVCLNVGCIPSKALLHAAKVISEAEEMGHFGVKFAKPEVDVDGLARLEGERGQEADRRPLRARQGAQGDGGRGGRHLRRAERDPGRGQGRGEDRQLRPVHHRRRARSR